MKRVNWKIRYRIAQPGDISRWEIYEDSGDRDVVLFHTEDEEIARVVYAAHDLRAACATAYDAMLGNKAVDEQHT